MSIHSTGLGHDEAIGVVGTRRAKEMLDCGTTYLYELIAAGLLESYKEGKSRKITTRSIKSLIERRLAESRTAVKTAA
jgi:hypothetical protein